MQTGFSLEAKLETDEVPVPLHVAKASRRGNVIVAPAKSLSDCRVSTSWRNGATLMVSVARLIRRAMRPWALGLEQSHHQNIGKSNDGVGHLP